MKTIPLFPTDLFEFENTNIDNSALIPMLEDCADQVKQSSTMSFIRNIHDNKNFAELFLWIRNCLNEVKESQRYDCDSFEITSSWFNRALPGSGMNQNYHRHSMSFFSGIYYITNGAPTVFEDPVIHRTQAQLEVLRKEYAPREFIHPTPGKLIIFPSWMYHSSSPHFDNYDRYVISFNTMPAGYVNYNLATDSVAHISIETKDKKI